MSTQVQWRKGTTAQHSTFTGANAEVTVDTTKKVLVVHDGATAGGIPQATEASVTNHLNDTADAHAASAITNTPAGNIAATTVQAALNELDTEKIATSAIGVSVEAYDATILKSAAIGVTVQGYDVDTAKLDVVQTWAASQRTSETTDNDGSFDLNAAIDFKCTPTAGFALTFTNIPATPLVQKGTVILVNGSNYAITAHANTKVGSSTLATISATGTYELAYRTSNGVVYITSSGALS